MNDSSGSDALAERRACIERLLALGGEPEAVARIEKRWIRGAAGKLRVWIYTPVGAPVGLLPGLVYFHGGGFVGGSLETHDGICRSLANASGCRVLAVDYRLAHEALFPDAVLDACSATLSIAEHAARFGVDFRAIGVAGDSTGATLAALVARTFATEGGPPLALQCLLCPVLDYSAGMPPADAFGCGELLGRETLRQDLEHYVGGSLNGSSPRISLLDAEPPAGLPAASIHTAESDPLREQGAAYAAQLEGVGVRVSYRSHPGMTHFFYGLKAVIPYAATAFRLMGEDIRALL